jgi:hypothetical protein
MQTAALLGSRILDADPTSRYIMTHVQAIEKAREQLDDAMRSVQQRRVAYRTLPRLHLAKEKARCAPRYAMPPCPVTPGATSIDTSIANLAPMPRLLDHSKSTAGEMLQWMRAVQNSGGDNVSYVVCSEVEKWFFARTQGAFSAAPLSKDRLSRVSELGIAYRQHVRQMQKGDASHILTPELVSREALVVWIILCLAYQAAAYEWPSLLNYSLPVSADDLRVLVLACPEAVKALLQVAEFVTKHTGIGRPVFSTRDGPATWSLASEYAAESQALQKVLAAEAKLAKQREDALWAAVDAKLQRLAVLDADLATALEEKKRTLADERQAFKLLTQLAKEEVSRNARYVSPLDQSRVAVDDQNHASRMTGQDSESASGRYMSTTDGQAWSSTRQTFVTAFKNVKQLEKEIVKTEKPPPDLFHTLPHPTQHRVAARTVVFFLCPEHTGSMPLLAQYCFEAAQCLLPSSPPFLSSPSSSSERHQQDVCDPRWDVQAAIKPDVPHRHTWAAYFNNHHHDSPYLPMPSMCTTSEEADGISWVLLASTKATPQEAVKPRSRNVRDYDRAQGHGMWYPSFDNCLLWQGGTIPRSDLGGTSPSNPFPELGVEGHLATVHFFTEPGPLAKWMRMPTRALSRLGSFCENRTAPSLLEDCDQLTHCVRGNAVLAFQSDKPEHFSNLQWQVLAGLRAYPMTQLPLLCAALQDGSLHSVLHDPAVCYSLLHCCGFLICFTSIEIFDPSVSLYKYIWPGSLGLFRAPSVGLGCCPLPGQRVPVSVGRVPYARSRLALG